MQTQNANYLIPLADDINRYPLLTQYLQPAKRGFVCIECGNGEGDDGTGAVVKDNKLKCGKCQHSFNNIDIIARHLNISTRGKDFVDVVKYGCQIFGLHFIDPDSHQHYHNFSTSSENKPFQHLAEAQRNLQKFVDSQGGNWRGLSLDTLKHIRAGFLSNVYFPAAKKELPAVVIPNDLGGVYFRSITGKFHKNNTPMATTTVYLPDSDNFDLIITEGQINAASIFQAVPNPTFGIMACSGTSGEHSISSKLKELIALGKKFRVIVAFDNDSNNAGQTAALNLRESLLNLGVSTVIADITKTADLDLNDVLRQDNGKKSLERMILNAKKLAQENFDSAKVEAQKAVLGENICDYFADHFEDDIADNKKFANRKTGFDNLDEQLKFFLPGVYVVSGLPSLGKTSFCLQLLEQMAKSGNTCIFCSFEMSRKFLFSKIFAREVFRIESQKMGAVKFPLTSTQIFMDDINDFHKDAYDSALSSFKVYTYPFYIWEETKVDVDNLIARLRNVCSLVDKPPIVCIDYLQLLGSGSDKPKAAIDDALQKFFNFRRETNTTFILISSLNRSNYNTDANLAGLKESGGIEYSADGIFFLQYLLDTRTNSDTEAAMKKIPREIQLKCLKYRFGSQFDIGFLYYPNADTFTPMNDEDYIYYKSEQAKQESTSDSTLEEDVKG